LGSVNAKGQPSRRHEGMSIRQYKALFVVITVALSLFVASPALQRVLVYPQTDFFTEAWLLGPSHAARDYPYNITLGGNYSVFLGLANHLGSCAYYQIEVKFRNETQSAPNNSNQIPSDQSVLAVLPLFVANNQVGEIPISFAFDYSFRNVTRIVLKNVTMSQELGSNATVQAVPVAIKVPQVVFNVLTVNSVSLSLRGETSDWNSMTNEFYGNLVFEIWLFNSASGNFQYHNRSLDLKFNITSAGLS
jgi:hypothetical protein